MRYCKKCGNQLSDDILFCQKCGTKVEAAASGGRTSAFPMILWFYPGGRTDETGTA